MCVTVAGSWWHCAYHLTTSIVSPAILSLPFALSLLGWVGGVFFLTMTALVTFYSYNLLSVVLEHHAQLGQRQLRFRDMATDILGGWHLVLYYLILGWIKWALNPSCGTWNALKDAPWCCGSYWNKHDLYLINWWLFDRSRMG